MYKLGETITVVKTSKMKLKPIKDINKAPATLVGLIPSKRFIKNNKQKIAHQYVVTDAESFAWLLFLYDLCFIQLQTYTPFRGE